MNAQKSIKKHLTTLATSMTGIVVGAAVVIVAALFAGVFSGAPQTAFAAGEGAGANANTGANANLTTTELGSQSGSSLTRAEWIARLSETFNMTVEAIEPGEDGEVEYLYPDDYFEDVVHEHPYFVDIMKATDFGVVDTPAGELFRPDDPATREFAAHTLNYCLGFLLDEGASSQYTDDDTAYPTDMQVALNRGWFGNTKVNATTDLSEAEADAMIDDAKAVLADTADFLAETDENGVQFASGSGVKIVPKGTAYTIDATTDEDGDGLPDGFAQTATVAISDCPITIAPGDLFAVYNDDLPIAFEAVSVQTLGNVTVISAVDADEDVYATLAYSTEREFDLSQFQEAEGVTTQTFDSLEEAAAAGAETGGFTTQSLAAQGVSYNNGTLSFSASVSPTTITGSITGVKANYAADKKKNRYYLTLSGTAVLTGTIAGQTGDISIPLGGEVIGPIKLSLEAVAYAEGSITVTTSSNFEIGAEYSGGSCRMIKSFKKGESGLSARATAGVMLQAAASAKVTGLTAYARARIGYEANYAYDQYDDKPFVCQDFQAYLFAGAAAGISAGFGPLKKSESWKYTVWDANNSPQRMHTHIEDGSTVGWCTRGKHYPHGRFGIRWGHFAGDGSGGGDGPVEYAWYEYELDDAGNATITKYHGNMRALIVPDTVEGHKVVRIGRESFKENGYLTTVVLPEGVTHIDDAAFWGCKALTMATLPAKCTVIGHEAFRDCMALNTVNIPKNVNEGENNSVFPGCESLSNVSFASGTTFIADSLFSGSGLKEAVIPDTVTRIGREAYADCTQLRSIRWGKAIAEVGDGAFEGCTALTSVDLPATLRVLGNRAFKDCASLASVSLPKDMETGEFCGYFPGPFTNCWALKSVRFAEGTTFLAQGLFMDCGLEEVTIPDTVTEIRKQVFDGCTLFKTVHWSQSLTKIDSDAFKNCSALTAAILPDSLTYLGCNAFHNCDALAEIYIPSGMRTGDYAGKWGYPGPFDECDCNAKVTLAEGRETIPDALFMNFVGLAEVTIPASVNKIGWNAFADTTSLKKITIPTTVTEIADSAFAGSGLTEILLPDSVTTLGSYAFDGCTALAKVTLPSTLTRIEGWLLRNTAITEITIPDPVSYIGERAFAECGTLATVNWGKSLKSMDTCVFEKCPALKSVSIPGTVEWMGSEVFIDCDALTTVTIPSTVRQIGEREFYDCDALTTVTLGGGLTRIPNEAFRDCDALATIVISHNVKTIGENAFAECVKLTSVTIPKATEEIGDGAFSYPTKMTVYGVTGSTAQTWASEKGAKFVAISKPATSVTLNYTELTMYRYDDDREIFLVPDVQPADYTDDTMWKSTDESVVTIGEDGRVNIEGLGTATIKFLTDELTATCTVSVVMPVRDVNMDPQTCAVDCGDTVQLSASPWPWDAADQTLEWSSSDTTLATVDQTGKVTTLAPGEVTIKATAKDRGVVYGTCDITIKPVTVATSVDQLESAHDYANNFDGAWKYTLAGATSLDVTFDSRTMLDEDTDDFLYIYDANGEEVGQWRGAELAGKTVSVPGDTVKIRLVTDNMRHAWGFKVTSVVAGGGFGPEPVEPTVITAPKGVSFDYDGLEHTGVYEGEGYSLSGTASATVAGDYVATATADEGYVFEGGKTSVEVAWSIARAVIPVPVGESFDYDGKTHTGVAAGEGYSLSGTAKATAAGDYTATATADANHVFKGGKTSVKVSWSIKAPAPVKTKTIAPTGKTLTYNGKAQTGVAAGAGYTLSGTVKATAGGSYKAVATLAAGYVWSDGTTASKTITWKINPAKQTVTFKAQSKPVKYSKVKKAKQSVAITKAKAKTNLTYAISKALKGKKNMKSRFSIASSTGKITVKKGTPKGTYKVTVKATAKKTGNYKAANKSAVITIKIA